jgi:hypothetical protein
MRRDDPSLANRVDHEAAAMSTPADPQAVLDAIKDSHDEVVSLEPAKLSPAFATHPQFREFCCPAAAISH